MTTFVRDTEKSTLSHLKADNPFVAAFAATRMPMLITDPHQPDNPIIYVNNAFLDLTGYGRDEVMGMNCRFLQGPGTNSEDTAKVRDAVARQESLEIDLLNYRKDGTSFWNRLLVSPVFDDSGRVTHYFASQFDVSPERNRLTELVRTQTDLELEIAGRMQDIATTEARLRFVLGAARMGTWTLDVTQQRILLSKQCLINFGRKPHETFGLAELRQAIVADDLVACQKALENAIRDRSELHIEFQVTTPEGEIRWIEMRGHLITDTGDPQLTMVGVSQNITERKQTEQHRQLLTQELAHRVKNSFATAQAVFSQTLRNADDMEEARTKATGRIRAMQAAQDLLTREGITSTDLQEVVQEALKPFQTFDITIEGPPILLDGKSVSAFILALYELATNSLKYGALSVSDGSVAVTWKTGAKRAAVFEFVWLEKGGPTVAQPKRRGFGSTILADITPADLRGRADLRFDPAGFVYTLTAPLPEQSLAQRE